MHLIERIEFVHALCEVKVHNIVFESPQGRKDIRQRF